VKRIEDTITDGVLTARARLPAGEGADHCVEGCDDILEASKALPARGLAILVAELTHFFRASKSCATRAVRSSNVKGLRMTSIPGARSQSSSAAPT